LIPGLLRGLSIPALATIAMMAQTRFQALTYRIVIMAKIPYVFPFILAILLFSSTIKGYAQNIDPYALESEPPLIESDINVYKKILETAKAAGSDQLKLTEVYAMVAKETGVTEAHAYYVLTKVSLILSILHDPEAKDQYVGALSPTQGYLIPTDLELELVNNHMAELLPGLK
jgi:hypothetical protein